MTLQDHHAHLVTGKWSEMRDALTALIEEEFDTTLRGNPDYWLGEYGTMGIDAARALAESQTRKAFRGGEKIFILAFDFITSEAQNALLKVFEEPTARTHFFVVTPLGDTLLPTLRSRLAPLALTKDQRPKTKDGNFASGFLKGDMKTRLRIVEPIVEEKDKASALALLDDLERELHDTTDMAESGGEARFALGELIKMRGYLRGRAPSVKMILEYVALVTPRR
jgi:hypothetical protein